MEVEELKEFLILVKPNALDIYTINNGIENVNIIQKF